MELLTDFLKSETPKNCVHYTRLGLTMLAYHIIRGTVEARTRDLPISKWMLCATDPPYSLNDHEYIFCVLPLGRIMYYVCTIVSNTNIKQVKVSEMRLWNLHKKKRAQSSESSLDVIFKLFMSISQSHCKRFTLTRKMFVFETIVQM